jgi:hypothetical protein
MLKFKSLIFICLLGFFHTGWCADYTVGTDTWDFENFSLTTDTTKLWELFQRAYLDVGTDYATAAHDDKTFFDSIIMQYADHGCCFGMSELNVICYYEGGHLSACSPVVQYEGDDVDGPDLQAIRDAVSIMHIRQMGKNVVSALIEKFDDSNWNDPLDALNEADYYLSSGDLPILCLLPSAPDAFTQISNGDNEAHVIVPYKVDTGLNRIYCYDPNFTYSQDPDFYEGSSQRNYIELGSSPDYEWVFPTNYTSSASYGWEGSMSSGPWSYIILPYSLGKYRDNHPLDVGYALSEISSILFAGDGDIEQISDDKGKSFYSYSGSKVDFEKDPSKKLYGVIRWPFFHKTRKGVSAELYFGKNMSGRSFDIDINSKAKPYTCQFQLGDQQLTLKVDQAVQGKETCRLKSLGTRKQAFEISSNRTLANVEMTLLNIRPDKKETRTFKISKLNIAPEAPVRLNLADQEQAIQMRCEKAPLSCQVEVIKQVKDKVTRIAPRQIDTKPDQETIIRPQNWKELKKDQLQIEKKTIDRTK